MTSLFLRWSTLYLWLHIFSPNFVPIAVLLADFIAKIVLHIYWFHVFEISKPGKYLKLYVEFYEILYLFALESADWNIYLFYKDR